MIQQQELRRGNIIGRYFHNPTPKGVTKEVAIGEVMEIREESVNMTAKLGRKERVKLPYESLTPIELTEEWFLKSGFTQFGDNMEYFEHEEFPQLSFLNQGESFKVFDFGDVVLTHVKYVHQLQNLYFSLTGQELTIKIEGQCSKPVKNEPLNDICEKCNKGEMIWNGKVLTSSPPKYKHTCDGCGNQEIWDAIIGQGKNESQRNMS